MPLQQDNGFNELLQKVGQFVKLATSEIDAQQGRIVSLRKQAAVDARRHEEFGKSLSKAAQALYDADFITDEVERKQFLKKASEDPSYLSSVIVKVCNAADVALIGSPARVAMRQKQGEEFDPVKAKAFGWDYSSSAGGALDDL